LAFPSYSEKSKPFKKVMIYRLSRTAIQRMVECGCHSPLQAILEHAHKFSSCESYIGFQPLVPLKIKGFLMCSEMRSLKNRKAIFEKPETQSVSQFISDINL